jgi:hypothetical protein
LGIAPQGGPFKRTSSALCLLSKGHDKLIWPFIAKHALKNLLGTNFHGNLTEVKHMDAVNNLRA